MTTESNIALAPDSTGKGVATVTITRPDGTTVYRQEIVLADADVDGLRVQITPDRRLIVEDFDALDLLNRLVKEADCIRRSLNVLANTQYVPDQFDPNNIQT